MNIKKEILKELKDIVGGDFPYIEVKEQMFIRIDRLIDKIIQDKNKEFKEKIKSCPIKKYNGDFEGMTDRISLGNGWLLAMEKIEEWQRSLLQELNKQDDKF